MFGLNPACPLTDNRYTPRPYVSNVSALVVSETLAKGSESFTSSGDTFALTFEPSLQARADIN